MTVQRLYTVRLLAYPKDGEGGKYVPTEHSWEDPKWVPDGWDQNPYSVDLDGNPREFFWPTDGKVYKSRSSAQERVDLIQSYGATAVVLETETAWMPVAEANALRKRRRDSARVEKLRQRIREIEKS